MGPIKCDVCDQVFTSKFCPDCGQNRNDIKREIPVTFDSYAHGDKETGYGLCEEMGIDVDSKLGQVIHYLNYEVKITYKIVGDTVVPIKVNCGGEEGDCDVVPIKE